MPIFIRDHCVEDCKDVNYPLKSPVFPALLRGYLLAIS